MKFDATHMDLGWLEVARYAFRLLDGTTIWKFFGWMNERQQQHINGVLFGLVVVLNSPQFLPRRRKLPDIN